MNDLPLQFFIDSIEKTTEQVQTELNDIFPMDDDYHKVGKLYGTIGHLQGELAYLRQNMRAEIKKKNRKKLYQFWKK